MATLHALQDSKKYAEYERVLHFAELVRFRVASACTRLSRRVLCLLLRKEGPREKHTMYEIFVSVAYLDFRMLDS